MKKLVFGIALSAVLFPLASVAEILAMANYESRPDDSLKELKLPFGGMGRKEGIAIFDVDPQSENYGKILMDIPLPPDLVAHHLFYNKDATKIYVTSLAKPEVRVIDMTTNPYRVKVIEVPGCEVGEDIVFSEDNTTWYETCMGSSTVMVGDAVNDTFTRMIELETPYPHGIAVLEGIDRLLTTSTVRASDLQDAGEVIAVVELSTGKELSQIKVSDKPSPSAAAPVELLPVPQSDPPVVWITNMYGNSLWTLTWDSEAGEFAAAEGFDFSDHETGVPLEIYFTPDGSRMYVTTANPGHLHLFDLSEDGREATLVETVAVDQGAHHVAFDQAGDYAWVQNSLLNLPGMSAGTISVVDRESMNVIDTMTTFVDNGFNPNCIVLLPKWNDPMGH